MDWGATTDRRDASPDPVAAGGQATTLRPLHTSAKNAAALLPELQSLKIATCAKNAASQDES